MSQDSSVSLAVVSSCLRGSGASSKRDFLHNTYLASKDRQQKEVRAMGKKQGIKANVF